MFWQDPSTTYRDVLGSLDIPSATVIDATDAELTTKRRVLREEPQAKFVIYRAGEEPEPTEDLIYDVVLRSARFSCSEEGVWAEECGIPAELAGFLADHATFFNSKERVATLKQSTLPKATIADLEVAMAAAALSVREGTRRDVARAMARRIVVELARGKDESLRAITSSGLSDAFWRVMRDELGYCVPDGSAPSPQDLAFRLVEGTLADLVEDPCQMTPSEASRVVAGLTSNARSREAYEWLCAEFGSTAFSFVPEPSRSYDTLAFVEHVPHADQWMLTRLAKDAVDGVMERKALEDLVVRRTSVPCAVAYVHHYATLVAFARLSDALNRYQMEVPAAITMVDLLEGYAQRWYEVDLRYREMRLNFGYVAQGRFGQSLASAVQALEARYDAFLSDGAARWQDHLLDEGPWPTKALPKQTDFFRDYIARKVPEAASGHRIGVVISDALRFECAVDLAQRLNASKEKGLVGKSRATVEARAGVVPSYTQLGMAALLPEGPMEIDPGTALVTKGGAPTTGTKAREALVAEAIPGSVAFQADELPQSLPSAIASAPVVYVYHNVIDRVGDKQATEGRTFKAVEEALGEIEKIAAHLLLAGCGTVLVTSDHGFIYQDRELEPKDYADVSGLQLLKGAEGVESERTRRFVVSDILPKSDLLVEYTSEELSLEGGHLVGTPRGAMRLRLSGSGARFVHGGVSPQECVAPVVVVEQTKAKVAAHPSGVSAFCVGSPVITGPCVLLDVYQEEPVGDLVTPANIKVGVYDNGGRLLSSSEVMLELASTSASSDDRKTRVRVDLTDDVDSVGVAMVRVSKRVGASNAFKTAWEREYRVNRAMGMDF